MHLDGNPIRSCSFPVEAATSGKITTIEGLQGNVARAVVEAWREKDVVQCGYCQSAQITSAVGLLSRNSKPSDSDINAGMARNACRCVTYVRIRDAVHLAAEKLEV